MTGILNALLGFINSAAQALDPFFNQVVLLLHGDGTNGAQNNTFLDGSTNNFTITRNGNTTQGTFSPFSVGAGEFSNFFDGNGDYFNGPNNSALNLSGSDFCIESWIYLTALPAVNNNGVRVANIVQYGTTTTNQGYEFYVDLTSNEIGIIAVGTGNVSKASFTFVLNTWYHVAVTNASGTYRVFVNGQSLTLTANTFPNNSSASGTLRIGSGRLFSGYANDFPGYISNIRIVKGSAVYTATFTPPTTPLTAITNTSLLTCQSNRFVDNSSNAFAITRNGDVRVTPFSPFAPTAAYSASVNGGSGYFDGSGDYLLTPSDTAFNPSGQDITVDFWVYLNRYPNANSVVFEVGNSSVGDMQCTVHDTNEVRFQLGGAIGSVKSGFALHTWHYVTCVKSGTNFTVYLDAVAGNTVVRTPNSKTQMYIGAQSGGNTMDGYISNFRYIRGSAIVPTSIPTAPLTAITNTSLLLNFTNAGIFDNTGKNNLETVGNAQIDTGTKKYGTGSLEFDGTGDWLLIPNSPDIQLGTGNFTIEFWVYLNAISAARGFVAKGGASTGWLVSLVSTNTVRFTFTTSTITSTGTLAASTWYHIAVVREGTGSNQTKIYINGTNDGTGTVSTDFNQTESMYVGANRTGGDALNGFIDDLRITKGIARYTANFTPPTAAFPDE